MLGAALVLGAALGSGAASSAVTMSDGVTWLPDEQTGQLVQVNPGTGRAERRLTVAGPGADLEVTQQDGHLVVGDARTGTITSIDLSTLLTGGQRRSEEPMQVLVGGGQAYLVTPSTGVVRAVDPLTLRDLGAPYRVGAELVDVVVDRGGTVWAVTSAGRLVSMTWRPDDRSFDTGETTVRGGGSATRLLPHDRGVTVFAPDSGSVLQVGSRPGPGGRRCRTCRGRSCPPTARRRTWPPPGCPAARRSSCSPATRSARSASARSAASAPAGRPSSAVSSTCRATVPAASSCCGPTAPGRARTSWCPVVGTRELLVDDGRLVVHTEDGGRAVMVETDGTTRVIDTGRGQVPAHDPNDASTGPAAAQAPGRGSSPASADRETSPAATRATDEPGDEPAGRGRGRVHADRPTVRPRGCRTPGRPRAPGADPPPTPSVTAAAPADRRTPVRGDGGAS